MKSGEILGAVAIGLILLSLAWTLAGPGTKVGNTWSLFTNGPGMVTTNQQSLPPAAGSSVVGGPSLSAMQINAILTNANSPAAGLGDVFYSMSIKYGIDDAYAAAFYKHESSLGLRGEAVDSKSIGNIRCLGKDYADLGTWCQDNFAFFPSWTNGIEAWYRLIKNLYVGQWGCTTVEQIIPHYAPAADHNNEAAYASAVEQDVQAWRAA